jgi:hypothetical protein
MFGENFLNFSFWCPAKLSYPLAILKTMTNTSFPVRTPVPVPVLLHSDTTQNAHPSIAQSEEHPNRVVAFRARNPIELAERFSVELSDMEVRLINCDDCVMQRSPTCNDCVVSYLLTGASESVVSITAPELDTLEMLQTTGFAPPSQYAVRPVAFARRRRAADGGVLGGVAGDSLLFT